MDQRRDNASDQDRNWTLPSYAATGARATAPTCDFCVGHVGPEAAVGGPIRLVRDGGTIVTPRRARLTSNSADRNWKSQTGMVAARAEYFTRRCSVALCASRGPCRRRAVTHPGLPRGSEARFRRVSRSLIQDSPPATMPRVTGSRNDAAGCRPPATAACRRARTTHVASKERCWTLRR